MLDHLLLLYYFLSLLSGAGVFSLLVFFSIKIRNIVLTYYLLFFFFISIKIFSWIIYMYFGILHMDVPPLIDYVISEFSIYCVIWSLPLFFHALFDVPFRKIANLVFIGITLYFITGDLVKWILGNVHENSELNSLIFGSVLLTVILYCLVIGFVFYRGLKSNLLKKIARSLLIITLIFLPGFISDSLLPWNSKILLTPLFYLVWNGFTLFFIMRYLLLTQQKLKVSHEYLKEFNFTKREIAILDLLLQGFNNKAIAEKAFVSLATVKSHLHSIYFKTDTKNRHELVILLDQYLRSEE
jgi:DNA-binding CsgD family transcriptional regulator